VYLEVCAIDRQDAVVYVGDIMQINVSTSTRTRTGDVSIDVLLLEPCGGCGSQFEQLQSVSVYPVEQTQQFEILVVRV